MMAAFLSEEWMASYVEAMAAQPEIPGLDTTIQYVVSGSPDGKVSFHETIEAGRTVAVSSGKNKEAAITVTWKYEEAVAEHSGERSVEVAYMAARNKIEGDSRQYLLDLLPMRRTEAYQSARAALAQSTTFLIKAEKYPLFSGELIKKPSASFISCLNFSTDSGAPCSAS